MSRKPAAPAARQSIGIRTRTDLKQRLEQIAADNGRSLAQECEFRLERSLDERPHQKLGDPLPGVFSDEARRYLRAQRDVARLLETLADAAMEIGRVTKERDRDEVEFRTALRAAMDVAAFWHLWCGETKYPYPSGPQPHLGARLFEMPAAHLGHQIATERMKWLDAFREEGVSIDTAEGRIMDAYTGNGRGTVFGPTPEETVAKKDRIAQEAKAAMARGDIQWEDPENLHKYKVVSRAEDSDDDGLPPARSLKEIMGR